MFPKATQRSVVTLWTTIKLKILVHKTLPIEILLLNFFKWLTKIPLEINTSHINTKINTNPR